MTQEADLAVVDRVEAELVECAVPEPPTQAVPIPAAPDSSPVAQAMEATEGQTGADPPPEVTHG